MAHRFRFPIAARLVATTQLVLLFAGSTMLAGCNDYPVHSLLDSFEVRVTRALARDKAVKIDFLWMIDHSSSMCQEQRQLSQGFGKFIKNLQDYGKTKADDPSFIDAQMAVVTVQQLPDAAEIKRIGQFVHKPATDYPPACIERIKQPCMKDADCTKPVPFKFYNYDANSAICNAEGQVTADPLTDGSYYCKANIDNPQFNNNDNCSINTTCQFRCTTDADCWAMYEKGVPEGQHRIKCNKATVQAGCMYPPETSDCPGAEQLPGVLKQGVDIKDKNGKKIGTQLDWFHCIANVGAIQTKEAKFEGGLRSLWQALDPNGINCPRDKNGKKLSTCQYDDLVRPDAYLVLVVASDDDDCSYAFDLDQYIGDGTATSAKAAIDQLFPSELQTYCQEYGDRTAGNHDLANGYCEYLKFKDKQAGKPPRKCPSDCHTLTGADKVACQTEADANVALIVKDNASGFMQNKRFASVTDFVDRFRSLKNDPSRVIFAAITGDSISKAGQNGRTLPDQVTADRASYYRSFLRNQASLQAPYICNGGRGESGYGSRYIQVAKAFGDNGLISNICEGADFTAALDQIANTILSRVVKICLPHAPNSDPVTGEPLLKVTRVRNNGTPEDMKYVANLDAPEAQKDNSFYLKSTADCLTASPELAAQQGDHCAKTRDCPTGLDCIDGLCKVYSEAIYFPITPRQGDKVQVNYAADVGL
jgi:hypothetical protein